MGGNQIAPLSRVEDVKHTINFQTMSLYCKLPNVYVHRREEMKCLTLYKTRPASKRRVLSFFAI